MFWKAFRLEELLPLENRDFLNVLKINLIFFTVKGASFPFFKYLEKYITLVIIEISMACDLSF